LEQENNLDSVVIVIPIYKETLSKFEEISLQQCYKVLHDCTICFVIPKGLNLTLHLNLFKKFSNKKFIIKEFDKSYFKSTRTYNKLLISLSFYKKFVQFEYMLIYQTDCFVFRNDLEDWIKKGHDYIGAPWFDGYENSINKNFVGVGNGGFSLRKIKSFIKVLHSFSYIVDVEKLLLNYNKDILKIPIRTFRLIQNLTIKNNTFFLFNNYNNNEDFFWGKVAKKNFSWFKVPSEKEALKFSFEANPQFLFKLNNNQLPFGCHAWQKYDFNFWKKFIEQNGYIL